MGHAIVSGGARASVPISGLLAGDFAVGSSVYLMENGVATEYLVVNQGIPSASSLYDSSCDGTWLLRKDLVQTLKFNTSSSNDYENSNVNTYLNGDFLTSLGTIEQQSIKQVKIPYRKGSGTDKTVTSGQSGLAVKIFLLSMEELHFSNTTFMPTSEGACVSYFSDCPVNSASDSANSKRIAYLNGNVTMWWTRSPSCYSGYGSSRVLIVNQNGFYTYPGSTETLGVRPALVIPSNAIFDKNTLILKGVA